MVHDRPSWEKRFRRGKSISPSYSSRPNDTGICIRILEQTKKYSSQYHYLYNPSVPHISKDFNLPHAVSSFPFSRRKCCPYLSFNIKLFQPIPRDDRTLTMDLQRYDDSCVILSRPQLCVLECTEYAISKELKRLSAWCLDSHVFDISETWSFLHLP
jgi:hypothetical protein